MKCCVFNRASTAFDIESIVSDVADVTSCVVDLAKGSLVAGQVSSGGPATNTKPGQEGEDNQLNQITAKIKGKFPDLFWLIYSKVHICCTLESTLLYNLS